MTSVVRQFIRRERNRLVRANLEAIGYVLDYWMVYREGDLMPGGCASGSTALRAVSRKSSVRLHEERMARMFGGS